MNTARQTAQDGGGHYPALPGRHGFKNQRHPLPHCQGKRPSGNRWTSHHRLFNLYFFTGNGMEDESEQEMIACLNRWQRRTASACPVKRINRNRRESFGNSLCKPEKFGSVRELAFSPHVFNGYACRRQSVCSAALYVRINALKFVQTSLNPKGLHLCFNIFQTPVVLRHPVGSLPQYRCDLPVSAVDIDRLVGRFGHQGNH